MSPHHQDETRTLTGSTFHAIVLHQLCAATAFTGIKEAASDSGASIWQCCHIKQSGDAHNASVFTNMLVYAAVQHKCGGRWSVPVTLREEVSLSPTYADKSLVRLIPQTVI